MKRADLKVGEDYVLLSPSQRESIDTRFGPRAKRIRVLDTEPVWGERYANWSRDRVMVKATDFDGNTIEVADGTIRSSEPFRADEQRRGVRALVAWVNPYADGSQDKYTGFAIRLVPLSNIAMPWAEFIAKRASASDYYRRVDRSRRRLEEERKTEAEERKAAARGLNEALAGSDLTAKVLDGQLVLTGSPEALAQAALVIRGSGWRYSQNTVKATNA